MQARGADLVEGGAEVFAYGLEHGLRFLLVRIAVRRTGRRGRVPPGGAEWSEGGPGPAEGGGCAGPGPEGDGLVVAAAGGLGPGRR
ncbi:hypothetical protein Slala02_12230 [Streptomyces lavendulae subsp. lavendulae]|nr:hypothetical protein Slala01_04240 [Streptomyces lavendulae subsp. lavendulae]GLX25403.1 hypothetical protein Slala02_12230 [Streptomyces lavendulae subsp. lavendulae]